MRTLYLLFLTFLFGVKLDGQEPGYYFGPRLELGQAQFTGQNGFYDGLAMQIGLTSSRQFNQGFAVQFVPFIGLYNGQRSTDEGDGVYPNGSRKFLTYRDKYNIYSVEFPLLVKFSGGFRRAQFSIFGGPSLGYIMGGTRSKQYDDPDHNEKHGYSGHTFEDLKRGMYSGEIGVASELKGTKGLLAIDFRIHRNLSPLGRLEGTYFSAHMMTVGLAWTFNAL
jgi:hypothetical protein